MALAMTTYSRLKEKRRLLWNFFALWFMTILVLSIKGVNSSGECPSRPHVNEEYPPQWEWDEFTEFCQGLMKLREKFGKPTNDTLCEVELFDKDNLRMLFVLMLMIGYGAFVRSLLRFFKLSVPYTVILLCSGLIIGLISKEFCDYMYTYTAIARIPPKIILFVFLPVLIFESAFSITPHTFMRSIAQILIIALPGMAIATFATGIVVQKFLVDYEWDFRQASLFGAIISATDPVAVVSILRDLGTSEMLGVMIEGESLLNDGVAILLYEILETIITCPKDTIGEVILFVIRKFCQITLGGPLFGFFMGKVAVMCLSIIFNDATVEITITLVAAYMTYYVGEDILGVSGVMAVVVLGITMGSERTSISPEVESFVHHFWEMLGYLANTVLFMIVGIVITETALNNIGVNDWLYLLFLYIMLNIIRFLMLLLMYPLVSRIGYGLTWQNMIIMMWGGLRGAIGICLALDVYDNTHLCDTNLGPKYLFQTAGIVFLTLILNGTTTKYLLDVLKLTEISSGRIQDMANAMKQLEMAQYRTISMLKHDRFVADANWMVVDKFTTISNPYNKSRTAAQELPPSQSLVSIKGGDEDHHTKCPDCHAMVQNEPTTAEYTEMTEEARLRILKALKVSFWRQFEQGVLIELAVLQLVNVASAAEDKPLRLVHAHDLRKYWSIHGCLPWMKTKFTKTFGLDEEVLPPKPRNKCRGCLWWLSTRDWFDYTIIIIILINMIPTIWETVLLVEKKITPQNNKAFLISTIVFTIIYLFEMMIKIVGRGPKDYFWVNKSNWIDVVVLIFGMADIALSFISLGDSDGGQNNPEFTSYFAYAKILRITRGIRLLRPVVPKLMLFVDGKINAKLFLGYDVAKGFVTAVDDVIKFLPQMVDHPKVLHKLKHALERERLETVREMGIMQKDHPGIAIAVKTRHASRAALNQMREALLELKEDGLVDEKECDLLMVRLEENMKRLWKTPPSIAPAAPESFLRNVAWVGGSQEIYNYIHERAELLSFAFGDTICNVGESSNGVYIITSGMVKIHYIPTEEVVKKFDEEGEVPNMELFVDLSFRTKEDDFFSTGTVVGEKSILTGQTRAAAVKCETSVFAYHISEAYMQEALKTFDDRYDSLESRMWRAVGMRIAFAVLPKHPNYAAWTSDKIRLHVERSCVPVGSRFDVITVTNFVADVLVVQGKVKDAFSDEIFLPPSLVPRSVSKIVLLHTATVKTRVLLIAVEDFEILHDQGSTSSLQKCMEASVQNTSHALRESRSVADPLRRYSEHMNYGVRRKAKRDLSQKPLGFPKSVAKRKRRGGLKEGDEGSAEGGGAFGEVGRGEGKITRRTNQSIK